MLGRDHALSGALAFTAVAPLLHVTGVHLATGIALTAGAGVLPDLDEPGSTIARTFGFLTGAFAWIVHKISGGHRKGTHSLLGVAVMAVASLAAGSWQAGARAATGGRPELWWHLVPAGLILALLFSAGFRALHIGGHHGDAAGIALAALVIWKGWDLVLVTPWNLPVLAVCVTLGMLAHLAGDMCTHDGCPLLYPLSRDEFGLLPEPVRITTNKLAEHWVVSPLLIAGLAYFLWRDAGFSLTTPNHLAGRLSRRSARRDHAVTRRILGKWPVTRAAPDDAAAFGSGLGVIRCSYLTCHARGRHGRRAPGGYPGRAGGLWLWRILVLSGFHAVVVPSGFRTRVQPHRCITI
jgi:membrane-bound metal-dependent hydrolase YbcI (DUF457 family)